MNKETSQLKKKVGLPPGSLVYVGTERTEKVTITEVRFSENKISEKELQEVSQCTGCKSENDVAWLIVDGVHDTNLIGSIGKQFDLNPLMLEDIVNTKHRPKEEEFSNCLFLCLKIIDIDRDTKSVIYQQLSLVLSKNYLISFQEIQSEVIETFKVKIDHSKEKIKEKKEDYVFYRLIDTVVDNYFIVLDYINNEFNDLEDRIIKDNKADARVDIFKLKKELQTLKSSIAPLREAINQIINNDNDYINDSTEKYLRDLYQHITQITEIINSQTESINSFVDIYMAMVSNKMNEIMKFLTMFATIFIPLTFVAGVYGMNFDNIPELHWKYGYLFVWVLMGAIGIGFLIYFRKKKWL